MPKLSKALPSYRRNEPTGRAVVTLNGRDHHLGPYCTKGSKLEYDRIVAKWLQRGRQPAPAESVAEVITVVVLCACYLQFAKRFTSTT
jgi:hypothetical protein